MSGVKAKHGNGRDDHSRENNTAALSNVRGGVVVIDHGWGVYTAYDHLSEILVQPGDTVQPGQLVGLGGATGRTTGPHLHWEVWVGGVQVNPVDWM